MKKIVKPILQVFSIALVLTALLLFITNLLSFQCSSDEARLRLYYNEKENSMNVLLFGSSSVRAGFIPTKAYENYGITSYDYCVNHMPLAATEYMVKEAMSTQSPELIVIDINGITYCNKESTNAKSVAFTDNIRNGKNKIDALRALNDDLTWEYEVPFIKYHKNIYSIGKCINFGSYYEKYGSNQTVLKGYTTNPTNKANFEDDEILNHHEVLQEFVNEGKEYKFNEYESKWVDRMLDYCETIKDETEILFVRFPRPTVKGLNEWEVLPIYAMKDAIEERGFNFVDFTDYLFEDYQGNELDIDYQEHLTDETHFNHYGAEKFTDFLCEYILANYDITTYEVDVPNGVGLKDWNKCVELANEYYQEVILPETDDETHKEYYEFKLAKYFKIYGVA